MKTKAQIQSALEAVAVGMTDIVQNAASTNVDTLAKSPQSVLRNVHKLFDIDSTGVVTLDTVKFNEVFPSDGVINAFPFGSGTLASKQL